MEAGRSGWMKLQQMPENSAVYNLANLIYSMPGEKLGLKKQ